MGTVSLRHRLASSKARGVHTLMPQQWRAKQANKGYLGRGHPNLAPRPPKACPGHPTPPLCGGSCPACRVQPKCPLSECQAERAASCPGLSTPQPCLRGCKCVSSPAARADLQFHQAAPRPLTRALWAGTELAAPCAIQASAVQDPAGHLPQASPWQLSPSSQARHRSGPGVTEALGS